MNLEGKTFVIMGVANKRQYRMGCSAGTGPDGCKACIYDFE